jgi:hypothetical protein
VKSEESLRSMSDATLALSARVNVDEILGSSGTSAVLLTLIHPIAWNSNSPKFISKILHSPNPKGLETADSLGLIPNLQPYILWCCINKREVGCAIIAALL